MDNKDNQKKKRKKAAGGGDAVGEKEHKRPWQEVYATVEEIKQFLGGRVYLRHNVVTGRTECRVPEADPFEAQERQESRGQVRDAWQIQDQATCSHDSWEPLSDRVVNSLWAELSQQKPVRLQDLYHVIESDFVPDYHPFRYYLDHLPPWDGLDHILAMSVTVQVKGGVEEQMRFAEYLKKWLVGMVAGWADAREVNHVVLIFVGEQGIYKTTWFNHLLPPGLQRYFYTKTNSGRLTKDDLLVLSQYGLVCYEELDTMSPRELNQLKSAVTMATVDERAAYAHFAEHRKHIASFCGTGNNVQFLSDSTGSRRWLPFEVERIESPRDHPFDYTAIYSQAYALYRQGFQYWFSPDEIRQLSAHNEKFETARDEMELVDYFFSRPTGADTGEFMPTAIAQQIVSGLGTRVSTVALGRAFKKLGFEDGTVNRCRGYYVVRRTDEERKMRARSLAYEKRRGQTQITDDTDGF